MKKTATKLLKSKASVRRTRDGKSVEFERGWNELEAQHDRLKSDWMSLSVQLGIGGRGKPDFD